MKALISAIIGVLLFFLFMGLVAKQRAKAPQDTPSIELQAISDIRLPEIPIRNETDYQGKG